jgi:stage V sporulation protein R
MGDEYAKRVLFEARRYCNDYLLINFLSDEDFQDFVNTYRLFVVGIRPSREMDPRKGPTAEIYIKSKSGQKYRELLNNTLYHPPHIDYRIGKDGELYLDHVYEGRTLVTKYIPSVLIGLEFFWGKPVQLETTEYQAVGNVPPGMQQIQEYKKVRVLYTCKNRYVTRRVLSDSSS